MKAEVPKLKTLPVKGSCREEQAHFIWIALVSWTTFNPGKTIEYGQLAQMLGYSAQAGRTLSDALGTVSLYCLYNDLPPLSCIVVEKNSGVPGWEGMIPRGSSVAAEQKKVGEICWGRYQTPAVETFRMVRDRLQFDDFV